MSDAEFEGVTVNGRGVGMGDADLIAQFREKKLAVGAFGRAGFGPAGNERVHRFGGHVPR